MSAAHAGAHALDSTENIASAYHNRHFHAQFRDCHDLVCVSRQGLIVNTEFFGAHESFTAEFEQDATILGCHDEKCGVDDEKGTKNREENPGVDQGKKQA